MLQHHLLLLYRNFKRSTGSFLINLISLSTGLACSLLIYLWVADELRVDKFHLNDSRLFRVMERQQLDNEVAVSDQSSGLLAETLTEELPEVELATAVQHYSWFSKFILSAGAGKSLKATGQFVSKDYFRVFSYGLIQGEAQVVLKDINSIVISDELARKLFNATGNLIGKTIQWESGPYKRQSTVSGVFTKVPVNSSEQFDFVLPFDLWKKLQPEVLDWDNNGTNTYVVLKPGTDLDQFNTRIAPLVDQFNTKAPPLIQGRNRGSNRTLFLASYSDKYLYGNYENGVQSGGRITYVKLFSIIAVFILLIACINFMNLSTAKASRRIKEVGVKKVIGATRGNLISQYLGESLVMACISLLVALLLVQILLPPFSRLTGKELGLPVGIGLIVTLLGITLFTGLVAGSYPALYLSGFPPAMVLKGKLHRSVGEAWTRKGLVVFQFSLSVILIVAVLVVYQQVAYIQHKNLGYTKDNVLYFEKEGKLRESQEAFLAEVKKIPGIVNASSTGSSIIGSFNTTGGVNWKGKNPDAVVAFEVVRVNHDLIETLDIRMAEGRSFSKKFGTDTSGIIFNETAVGAMGLKDPVGKTIYLWGKDRQIIGVTKDFHFESLHQKVKPLFFILQPQNTAVFMARISAGKETAVIRDLRKLHRVFNPGYAFEYKFLEGDFQAQYAAEQTVATLTQYFAGLAILISCLGLFGLASFTAERRRKEIGIRKVLGSGEWGIIRLLSGDFTRIVLTAIGIALPVSYLLTRNWLDRFAFRISLEWWYFAAAGLIALLVAWLTVGVQALKAARANPVESLKNE